MTRQTTAPCECPSCKKTTEVQIWSSINVMLHPEMRRNVLDGSAFEFVCPSCGARERLAYACLYHDQQESFMVYWVPAAEQDKAETLAMLENIPIPMPGYRRRIVTSRNRLREKILLFERGVDDRVIEVMKRIVWDAYLRDKGVAADEMYFDGVSGTPTAPDIELTILHASGQEPTKITIPAQAGYPVAYRILHEKFNVPTEHSPEWRLVDHTYMSEAEQGRG